MNLGKVEFVKKYKGDKRSQVLKMETHDDLLTINVIALGELGKKHYLKNMDFGDKFYAKLNGEKISFKSLADYCENKIRDIPSDFKKKKSKDKKSDNKSKSKKSDNKSKDKKSSKKDKKKDKKQSKKILKDAKKNGNGMYVAKDGHYLITRG